MSLTPQPDPTVTTPPQADLLLWLEGDGLQTGQATLQVDASGKVGSWRDMRGDRSVVALPGFAQQATVLSLTLPPGTMRQVSVLSCSSAPGGGCAYRYSGPNGGTLAGTGFSIFGMVQRASDRRDNYFVMTTGHGCSAYWGGTGCENNTTLHLGWSDNTTARFGQYGNDAVLNDTTVFDSSHHVTTFFSAHTQYIGTPYRVIEYLDRSMRRGTTGGDATTMHSIGTLMVGGTGYTGPFGPDVPDWLFDGQILALMIYTRSLGLDEIQQAESYLRNRFGPR
jgi:hypothetical protein